MTIFKKKITFPQFIADVIFSEFDQFDKYIDEWISMADEFKVLQHEDKEELKELGNALVVADVLTSSLIHFKERITEEDNGRIVATLYIKYMKEAKKYPDQVCEKNRNILAKLLDECNNFDAQDVKDIKGEDNQSKFALCGAFAKIFVGKTSLLNEVGKGKSFAAFKLAKCLVKADYLAGMLKEYKVIFN